MEEELQNNISDEVSTYLTFKLGKELFAVNVTKVLTILEMKPITKVPNSPEHMRGVINLRGQVLPVIDMRIIFGMEATEFTQNTCIIVLNINIDNDDTQLGILVDAVDQVIEVSENEIEESPTIGTKYKTEFIQGMYKLEDGFIMLLNIDLIFNADEILVAEKIENNAELPDEQTNE